jgi:hypothetical protein
MGTFFSGFGITYYEKSGDPAFRRCREFLAQIDGHPNGLLSRAANEQLVDEGRVERLRRLDRLSKDMVRRCYDF